MLAPGPRTVTAAFRMMGMALEPRFTNYYRVLNWATWSVHQGSRILLGLLLRPTWPCMEPLPMQGGQCTSHPGLDASMDMAVWRRSVVARES